MTHQRPVKPPRSIAAICEILGTEAFSEFTAAAVRRYARHHRSEREAKAADNIEAAFRELSAGFTPAQKRVFGEFISLLQREAFDAGLRAGLATRLFPESDE